MQGGRGINRLGQPGAKGKYWISQVRSMALRILANTATKGLKLGNQASRPKVFGMMAGDRLGEGAD